MQPSDEIKQKLDIVDVIRDYIQIKAAGMNFKANCPFHREKTPSFMVSPDKQIWHCFGCGKGGDIFTFVQEIEGVDFPEALRILAPKAGVELKRQDPQMASKRNRLMDIVDWSRKYYHKVLLESGQAKAAREYLAGRGLKEEIIEEWQIGFSPDSWDSVLKFLKGKGFKEADIFESGMIIRSQTGSRYYDRFRGRIMFPINDVNCNTVAFTARVSPDKEATEKMGKYINSPQTPIYDKSRIIFGLDKAKMEIKRKDYAIMVEGQMDVISAHQAGYKNVVAASGTALTADQITMLKRFSGNLAMAFDMDAAGQMAADRGMREAMAADLNLKVIELPQGKDPDDCIREDPGAWNKALKNAKPMMQWYFDRTFANADPAQADGKRKAAKELLPVIARLGNKIEKDHWIKKLAQKLDVDENLLREAVKPEGKRPESRQKEERRPAESRPVSREERLSELLLALIIKFPGMPDYAMRHVRIEQLVGDEIRGLYRKLIIYYNSIIENQSETEDDEKFLDYTNFKSWILEDEKVNSNLSQNNQLNLLDKLVILGDEEFGELENEQAKTQLLNIVITLKKHYLNQRKREIEKALAHEEEKGNENEVSALMEEFRHLTEELKDL